MTDSQGLKRRIIFHDGAKEIVTNPLHARVPVTPFFRNVWLNLSIDVFAFNSFCFKGVTMRSLDQIILGGPCKFRRIYTMQNPILDSQLDSSPDLEACLGQLAKVDTRMQMSFETAPSQIEFPRGIEYMNQLIFPQRLIPVAADPNPKPAVKKDAP